MTWADLEVDRQIRARPRHPFAKRRRELIDQFAAVLDQHPDASGNFFEGGEVN